MPLQLGYLIFTEYRGNSPLSLLTTWNSYKFHLPLPLSLSSSLFLARAYISENHRLSLSLFIVSSSPDLNTRSTPNLPPVNHRKEHPASKSEFGVLGV